MQGIEINVSHFEILLSLLFIFPNVPVKVDLPHV
jgi:hypothetical protein